MNNILHQIHIFVVGPPLGGVMYQYFGKEPAFLIVSGVVVIAMRK